MKSLRFIPILMLTAVCGLVSSCDKVKEEIDDAKDIFVPDAKAGKMFAVKSARIEYNDSKVFSFDNYGMVASLKESEETELLYIDGSLYSISHGERVYYKLPTKYADWNMYFSMYQFDEAYFKPLALVSGKSSKETIAGKQCRVYSATIPETEKNITTGGYKGICFLWDVKAGDYTYTLRATKYSESVPAGTFALPKDYEEIVVEAEPDYHEGDKEFM